MSKKCTNTIWFTECSDYWNQGKYLEFNPDNYWWNHHLELIKKAHHISRNDFLISIPDIIENIDVLSNMRSPQNLCYDLVDKPIQLKANINQIDNMYFKYYDEMYDIVKLDDGSSCYTAFYIWGPGKTAKVQCDFSALISAPHFREFILPCLQKHCSQLDNTLYHLDGIDAVRHLDSLIEIKELNALQWTPGAGKADGASEQWYPIYEKVLNAGKSLWISIYDGSMENWIEGVDKIVKTFGNRGMYFIFPVIDEEDAKRLIAIAEDKWS